MFQLARRPVSPAALSRNHAALLRTPGRPLQPSTRMFFEAAFADLGRGGTYPWARPGRGGSWISQPGDAAEQQAERIESAVASAAPPRRRGTPHCDFSHVRIHADERAAASARALNASAYTVGRDVVFGFGQYAPNTIAGRRLLAHELAHVVQESQGLTVAPQLGGGPRLHRKVVLGGAEMTSKERSAFLKSNKWESASLAASVMDDMAAADDAFDFADQDELRTEIAKRLAMVKYIQQSQEGVKQKTGARWKAFGYPFNRESDVYGPRVNYDAREYWEPPVADKYAERKDEAKNKKLRGLAYADKGSVYGDPPPGYGWQLTSKGKADPYHAITNLFAPQPPHKRTLVHCDYLMSLVHMRSFADSIGPAKFKERVETFGADKFFLKYNLFADLNVATFETDVHGDYAKHPWWKAIFYGDDIRMLGLGSTQRMRPSSKADLVIGDHVVFFNHIAYDLINAGPRHAWRLENAVLVSRSGGKDTFLGHGSGPLDEEQMRKKLADEFNNVVILAKAAAAKAQSSTATTKAAEVAKLSSGFNVHLVGKEPRIRGKSTLCDDKPQPVDMKLEKIDGSAVLGPMDPCNPKRMYPVERPIQSAK